jgi:hypothetical protein
VKADRLQPLPRQSHDLDQRTQMQPGNVFVPEIGGRRLGHPHRHAETLAASRHQVIRRRRPSATLTDPQRLTRQRVERIVDSCVVGIRILLTVGTRSRSVLWFQQLRNHAGIDGHGMVTQEHGAQTLLKKVGPTVDY